MHNYMFQCTDDVIAVLNAAYTKGESISPNIKHFTKEISIAVKDDAQHGIIM